MKPFCVLVMLVWRSSIFWSLGSAVDDVTILLTGGIPQTFEGMPASLICVTNSSFSDRIWMKDGIEIARCIDDMLEEKSLPKGVSVIPQKDEMRMTLFCILDFKNLTISDHDGSYMCLGKTSTGSSKAVIYNFTIRERKPFCEIQHVEYLLDDIAILSCHNPNYNLNRTILWLYNNTHEVFLPSQLTIYEYTSRLNTGVKMESVLNESVFSCHALSQEQLETFTGEDNYSCSVGPVFVYDTPFLSIMEVKDTVQTLKEDKVLNCRLVPSNVEGKVQWQLSESSLSYSVSTSGASSNITFADIGAFQGEVVNVTCEGFYKDSNVSLVYSLDLSTSPKRRPGIPSGYQPGFITPLFIVLVALGSLILIAVILGFCLIICKFQCSKETQTATYANDASFRKHQKQEGKDNDAVELDSNLQRYHPEPSQSFQSPSQVMGQKQYDVPPFGGFNEDTHGLNLTQEGYEIDERIYDPAAEEPVEYYEMAEDMEEYADISDVKGGNY